MENKYSTKNLLIKKNKIIYHSTVCTIFIGHLSRG